MTPPEGRFQVEVSFACPFCGRTAAAGGADVRDAMPGEGPAVIHAMPPCQRFLELGPVEYLHAVNVALGTLQ